MSALEQSHQQEESPKEVLGHNSPVWLLQQTDRFKRELEMFKAESKEKIARQASQIDTYEALYRMSLNQDVTPTRLLNAMRYLTVRGHKNFDRRHKEDLDLIDDAVKFFAGLRVGHHQNLCKYYYGLKDYSGFYHQRTDCEYRFGPSHGHIVFAIEVSELARRDHASLFTMPLQVREDCIYFLELFKAGKIEDSFLDNHKFAAAEAS